MHEANAHKARITQIEEFINDVLKEDLKQLEHHLNQFNEEIMEFVQLKNTLQTFGDHMPDGYKTQLNIGSNIFMQARVKQMDKILVNVGKGVYLEMSMEEAIHYSDVRIKILTKQADVVRDESIKKRSQIKMSLIAISEREKLLQQLDER
ncbi:protein UXT [Drosophila grimshawi]|uniref:GH13749 n=1 Tax=Drosophila grimshawi TaxID=7222 RepID=B4JQS7_DROGR|nr:protein UXT [Drosophila grimshawi]EDV99257.1 GH13749 [Drosophila grimshawi]